MIQTANIQTANYREVTLINGDLRLEIPRVEVAKLVRKALKLNFPRTKFSVRSESYAGGSSISVHWTDGPARDRVEPILDYFAGATFDGMTDSKGYRDAETYVDDQGRTVRVHCSVDFVQGSRSVSEWDARHAEAVDYLLQHCAVEGEPGPYATFGGQWIRTVADQLLHAQDFDKGETIADVFRRIVLREA